MKINLLTLFLLLSAFKAFSAQNDTLKFNAKKLCVKDSVFIIKERQCLNTGVDFTNNDTVFFKIVNANYNTIFHKNDSFYLFVYNSEKNLVDVMKYKLFYDFYPADTFNYKLTYNVKVPIENIKPQNQSQFAYYQFNLADMIKTAKEYKTIADSGELSQMNLNVVFSEELNEQIEKLSKSCSGPFELEIENSMSNSQLNFKLCNNDFGNLFWQIIDKSGNIVGNGSIEKSLIEQSYTIMFDNLPKGYYTLSVGLRSESITETFKITW